MVADREEQPKVIFNVSFKTLSSLIKCVCWWTNVIRDLHLLQFVVSSNGVTNFATRLSYTQHTQQDTTNNSETATYHNAFVFLWLAHSQDPDTPLVLHKYIVVWQQDLKNLLTLRYTKTHCCSITRTDRHLSAHHLQRKLKQNAEANVKDVPRIPLPPPTQLFSLATNWLLNRSDLSAWLMLGGVTYATQ